MVRTAFLTGLVLFCWSGLAAQTLHLGRNEKLVEQVVAQSLIEEIYRRAGYRLTVTPLPPARATSETVSGVLDGEVARVLTYGTRNPTLLRVEPAYYSLTSSAFARRTFQGKIATREDLRGYRVGILRGVQHSLDATQGLSRIEITSTSEQLYRLLDSGRIDLAIDTGINGKFVLQKLGFSNIREVATLATLDLFHYLAPGHQNLVAPLSTTITKLKTSGELAQLVRQAEKNFLELGRSP